MRQRRLFSRTMKRIVFNYGLTKKNVKPLLRKFSVWAEKDLKYYRRFEHPFTCIILVGIKISEKKSRNHKLPD